VLSVFRKWKSEILLLSFPCYERHSLFRSIERLLFWTLPYYQYNMLSFHTAGNTEGNFCCNCQI
jgi:hypothetical protein